jgi:hypothetical protein
MRKFSLLIILLASLCSSDAKAGSFWRYGLGVGNSAEKSVAETKLLSFGYEEDWFGPFIKQYEVGAYFDTAGGGRTSSGFGNISMGIEVNPGYLVLRSVHGVGAITTPDSVLGGWFQFNNDITLGIKDNHHNMIGLTYKHISSAGIYKPNRGRDFVVLQAEIPW